MVEREGETEVRWSEVVRVRKEDVRLGQSCDGEIQVRSIPPFSSTLQGGKTEVGSDRAGVRHCGSVDRTILSSR